MSAPREIRPRVARKYRCEARTKGLHSGFPMGRCLFGATQVAV